MGLQFVAKGETTSTGSEADLFAQVIAEGLHACKIHLDAMQAGDTIVIKVYNYDDQDAVERLFGVYTYTDAQSEPTFLFDFIPSTRYRVSLQRTAGSDRAISWERFIVT